MNVCDIYLRYLMVDVLSAAARSPGSHGNFLVMSVMRSNLTNLCKISGQFLWAGVTSIF